MLVSPKNGQSISLESITEEVKPKTYFLDQNASLQEEDPVLSEQNVYVSQNDGKKFGKIQDGKFYLKRWRSGRPGEILVDPYGVFSKPEDLSAFALQRGYRFCEYYLVKKSLFDTYVTYLETRNPVFFKQVERAIMNGEHI